MIVDTEIPIDVKGTNSDRVQDAETDKIISKLMKIAPDGKLLVVEKNPDPGAELRVLPIRVQPDTTDTDSFMKEIDKGPCLVVFD